MTPSRPVLAALLACALLGAGCGGSSHKPPEDDPLDADVDAMLVPCPSYVPRPGLACKVAPSMKCTFTVGTCHEPGGDRKLSASYCCSNGLWEPCGSSAPCEHTDAGAPDVPADAPADVPAADVANDGGAEVPTCGGMAPPALCGGEPCSMCPGGESVPCACVGSAWFCAVCGDAGAD